MILSTIISYLPYALITTFTPGPNNLISFYAVSTYGWKKGAKVLAGIGSAIFLIICITAVLCHHLASNVEAALPALKIFGSIYILWLAIHIAKDSPDNSSFDISTFKKRLYPGICKCKDAALRHHCFQWIYSQFYHRR